MEQRRLTSLINSESGGSIPPLATNLGASRKTRAFHKRLDDGSIPSTETTCSCTLGVSGPYKPARSVRFRTGVPRDGSSTGQNPRLITGHVSVRIRAIVRKEMRGSFSGENHSSTSCCRRVRSPHPVLTAVGWAGRPEMPDKHLGRVRFSAAALDLSQEKFT